MAPPAAGGELETGSKTLSSLQSSSLSSSPKPSRQNNSTRKKHHSPNPSRRNGNGSGSGGAGGGGSRRAENGRHSNNPKSKRSPPRNNNNSNRSKCKSAKAPRSLIIVASNEDDATGAQDRASKTSVMKNQDSFESTSSFFPPLPPPFAMCTSAEATDRQEHYELSIFECNTSSSAAEENDDNDGIAWRDRVVNPRTVVKKYRRSAAAGGVEDSSAGGGGGGAAPPALPSLSSRVAPKTRPTVVVSGGGTARPRLVDEGGEQRDSESPPRARPSSKQDETSKSGEQRSLESLDTTVSYLLGVLLPFQGGFNKTTRAQTLASTASFVDDRLRAVQVDLVTLLGSLPTPTAVTVPPPPSPPMSSLASKSSSLQRHVQKTAGPTPQQLAIQQQEAQREAAQRLCATLRTVRSMQARMIRYGILLRYLVSNVESGTKYEKKFGWQGLQTALTTYFEHVDTERSVSHLDPHKFDFYAHDDERREFQDELDELLSYFGLLKIASVLVARERTLPASTATMDDWGGFTSLLLDYQRHVVGVKSASGRFWKRALDIAAAADAGNYVRLLRLLQNDAVGRSSLAKVASTEGTGASEEPGAVGENEEALAAAAKSKGAEERWGILARCCMVPALTCIRIDMVRQFNKSFGKLEKVPATSLANLLHLPSSEAALLFAEAIGLPTNRTKEQHAVLSSSLSSNPPSSPVPPHHREGTTTAASPVMSSLQTKAAGMSSLAAAASSPKRTTETSSPVPTPPPSTPPPTTTTTTSCGLYPPTDYIVMKAAGISIERAKENGMANRDVLQPGRSEDPFVFGAIRHDVWTQLLEKGSTLSSPPPVVSPKVAPLSAPAVPKLPERSTTPPRVLGRRKGMASNVSNASSDGGPVESESLSPRPPIRRWADDSDSEDEIDDWEDVDDEEEEFDDEEEQDADDDEHAAAESGPGQTEKGCSRELCVRVDQDGVRVPPPMLIWDLIQ